MTGQRSDLIDPNVADVPGAIDVARGSAQDPERLHRFAFRIAAVLAILPIAVAAVRNGLDGWVPTWDAASTAFRVNDVFTRYPPLMGMWSSASHWSGTQINFIGALQLYALAVPVKLLGNTWGVLLGMAVINSAAVLTTLWLIRRRVGYPTALVGCAFVASLVWALGSEVIVDLTPMQMGVLPYLLLLVTAWSVADGDLPAVPILAFVANYLLLDHLTYVLTAPAIAGFGLVLLAARLRAERHQEPEEWQTRWRSARNAIGVGAAITFVVWIPPLVQQFFTRQPGNLTSLYQASRAKPPFSATMLGAASALSATVAVPPLWLRDTFSNPRFLPDGDGRPFLVGLGCMLLLLGLNGLGLFFARRRHDRTIAAALATALMALALGFVTVKKSPGQYGLRGNYLHGLWSLAAFLWMVLALALVRLWPTLRVRWRGRAPALGALAVTAVFCVLTIPRADLGAGTSAWSIPIAKSLDAQLIPALRGKGPIMVRYSGSSGAWAMSATVLLSLQNAGIPIRLEGVENARQYGFQRAYIADPPNARYIAVVSTNPTAPAGYERIVDVPALSAKEQAEMLRLEAQVRAWLNEVGRPKVSHALRKKNPDFASGVDFDLGQLVRSLPEPGDLVGEKDFQSLATAWLDKGQKVRALHISGIDPKVLQRWGELRTEDTEHHVFVYLAPIDRPGAARPDSGPSVDEGDP